jgi:hypothetical protein
MLLANQVGGGWYFTLGALFHRAIEFGYQKYDKNYFDICISYIPKGRPHSGFRSSISFFAWFFEFNIYDTRSYLETNVFPNEWIEITEDDILVEEIPKKEIKSIPQSIVSVTQKNNKETNKEITEVYSFDESGKEIAKEVVAETLISSPPLTVKDTIEKQSFSSAFNEFTEYKCIAIRRWSDNNHQATEPYNDKMPMRAGSTVLIPSKDGGFHFLELHCDDDGWYIDHPTKIDLVNIVWNDKRKLWVIEEII